MDGQTDTSALQYQIGNDVEEEFAKTDTNTSEEDKSNDKKVTYENIHISPLCYMDDVFNMNDNVATAQIGNKKMEEVIARKGLEFNFEKSMFFVMGNKKARNQLKAELEKSPIKL